MTPDGVAHMLPREQCFGKGEKPCTTGIPGGDDSCKNTRAKHWQSSRESHEKPQNAPASSTEMSSAAVGNSRGT